MEQEMIIRKISIADIKPAKYNPRKDLKPGDPAYEKLKRSMTEFGYVEPIIWNEETGNIVGGHQRYKVLVAEGHTQVECVVVKLSAEREKALNVALNKVTGDWEVAALADLIKELGDEDFDVTLTGFDAAEIDELFNQVHDKDINEDDFDVDGALEKPTISKPGDIWLLGRHRLICGDSTEAETYETLMDGKLANLVVTDPPYNIDIQGGTKDKLTIKNDKMSDKDFYEFLLKFYKCTYDAMADGAAMYVFHADTEGINFRTALRDAGFHLSSVCIWVKNSLVLSRSDFHFRHEPILYSWKPTGKHKWYSDRKQDTIWNFDRPKRSESHPTMKPIPLMAYPIKNSSMINCIVLDPFAGSFSTGIACEQADRICYGIEIDPKYVDVCVSRFINQVETDEDVYLLRDGEKIKYADIKQAQPLDV